MLAQSPLTQIEFCERQIERCYRATCDETLSPSDRLGAQMGEVDWMVAKQIAEEDATKIE